MDQDEGGDPAEDGHPGKASQDHWDRGSDFLFIIPDLHTVFDLDDGWTYIEVMILKSSVGYRDHLG